MWRPPTPRAGATTPPTSAGVRDRGAGKAAHQSRTSYGEERGRGVPFAFQETPYICKPGGTTEVPGAVSAFTACSATETVIRTELLSIET